VVPIELVAPTTTGTYKVFFGFSGEFTLPQVFSNHNWQASGEVLWSDGNDYWDITDSKKLSFIKANGYLPNWFYLVRAANQEAGFYGLPVYVGYSIAVNYINVKVTP
jgi:hypothetical protein